GKFALTDKYTFVQADSQPGTGTIQALDPGAVMTVKERITMMIIVSDNTATEVLYRMVGGPEAVNRRMDALGLTHTRAMNVPSRWFPSLRSAPTTEQFCREGKYPFGLTTPREMGQLLEMMERGTLVDKNASDLMLRIMRGQLYRTRIPRYVSRYTIPHKPATSCLTSETMSGCSRRRAERSSSAFSPAITLAQGQRSRTPSAWPRSTQ